ncbi:SGNH/GDSL hydrolase family protein [candidate division KSB1 bacterium]|nr:SGNH/GDSL hydrolase family protein [candidate division KSB1 bacterium]
MRLYQARVYAALLLFSQGSIFGEQLAETVAAADTLWIPAQKLMLEGAGWKGQSSPFQRLPDSAQKRIRPPVWDLSRHSAGLCVKFVTDASTIAVRWQLAFDQLAMVHMPATGVSGVDLYLREGISGWRWIGTGLPKRFPRNSQVVIEGLKREKREYCLYLPLYNGIVEMEIGVPTGAELAAAPVRRPGVNRPLVFYGTSIIQGGCASRPGLASTAIIGRRLDRPIINLGFSGQGRMDAEMAPLLAEIDAELYILDCLPNMTPSQVRERTLSFVQTLRRLKPDTPVLLVESCWPVNTDQLPHLLELAQKKAEALQHVYDSLVQNEISDVYYLSARDQLGNDGEGTVDGIHPNDLGFFRQANHYEKALRQLLKFKSVPGPNQRR